MLLDYINEAIKTGEIKYWKYCFWWYVNLFDVAKQILLSEKDLNDTYYERFGVYEILLDSFWW